MTVLSVAGRARRRALAVAVTAVAMTLAACADDSPQSGPAAGATDTVTDTVVGVNDDGLLVDGAGMTLYTADVEENGEILCVGKCAEFWHPLTVPGETVTAPEGVSGLSTAERPDGEHQVTYDGAPVYTFTLDTAAGDTQGDGVSDEFGGQQFVWSTVRVAEPSPGATEDTPTPPGGGGGYGGY